MFDHIVKLKQATQRTLLGENKAAWKEAVESAGKKRGPVPSRWSTWQ
jgi:hypothetical protein